MLLEFDITLVLNAAPFSGSLLQMFPIYCLLDMHAGITRPLLSTEFHCCDQGLYFLQNYLQALHHVEQRMVGNSDSDPCSVSGSNSAEACRNTLHGFYYSMNSVYRYSFICTTVLATVDEQYSSS